MHLLRQPNHEWQYLVKYEFQTLAGELKLEVSECVVP